MGLDLVEFVIATEEAFGLAIPDSEAEGLTTPGRLVQYLEARLPSGPSPCLEQRAFYLVRRSAMTVLAHPRQAFRPETTWLTLLPKTGRATAWRDLGTTLNVSAWPRLWPWQSAPTGQGTVGDTARRVATLHAAKLLRTGEGWSRPKIEAVVMGLLRHQLGIERFGWNDRFVDELRID
ncbi:acyl carrier protein [Luteitalea sp.]|uniref:acyl carrier protein n=1 Tax=Luteitalea sp. TaxID=2004800 RepID=UPI0025C0C81E|nr:acyl carrier protein [Luteitalea sp.]